MTERVDICNLALNWLGEKTITSIDDDSERAKVLKINYELARDAALESSEWSFAIRRMVLSPLADTPAFGYSYAYAVPADILRVLTVEDSAYATNPVPDWGHVRDIHQVEWILEDGKILTNTESIQVRGIRRVTEEGKFSNLFVNAMAARLAYQCAMSLTESPQMEQSMGARFTQYVTIAESRDGLQGRSRALRHRLRRVR